MFWPLRFRRRCRALLAAMPVPDPFDLDDFCAGLAERRGRPLRLLAMPATGINSRPSGMSVATAAEDIVWAEPHRSALHHRHIVFHEIGHILWNHHADASGMDLSQRDGQLFVDLDPAMVQRMLARGRRADRLEREAEMFATMLSAGVSVRATTRSAHRELSARTDAGAACPRLLGDLPAVLTRGRGRVTDVVATGRALHQLRPLWRALRATEPLVVLPGPGWTTLLTPAGQRFRLLRRVIEIRDAQLALRPHAHLEAEESRPRRTAADPELRDAQDLVSNACWHQASRPAPACGMASISGGNTIDDEVAFLLALAAWASTASDSHRPRQATAPCVPRLGQLTLRDLTPPTTGIASAWP